MLNLGGPETLEQIQPYLFELFSDPEIIRLPFGTWVQKKFAGWISKNRALKAREKYQAIGGGSPLARETGEQAIGLSKILGMPVEFAMRYSNPRISDAIKNLAGLGAKRLIVIPLFPQYSRSTSGSAIAEFKKQNPALPFHIIVEHHDAAGYLNALASGLSNALKDLDPSLRSHLLFTAHSLPEKYLEQGDPYLSQTEETVKMLVGGADTPACPGKLPRSEAGSPYCARNFSPDSVPQFSLAFQSKLGPVKWHGPSLEQELDSLLKKGVEQLIVFPVSFVSENLETMFDLDLEFQQKCLKAGIKKFIRVPCPGSSEIYLNALAELVKIALRENKWESQNA